MRWRLLGVVLFVAGMALTVAVWPTASVPPSVAELRTKAREHLRGGRWAEAAQLCEEGLRQHPDNASLLLLAGEAAFRRDEFDAAVAFYDRVLNRDRDSHFLASVAAGDIERHRGRLRQALLRYRRARTVAREPAQLAQVDERLAFVLNISGQRWAAAGLMREMIERGQVTAAILVQLGDLDRVAAEPEFLKRAARDNSDDPLPRLGLARLALIEGDFSGAESHLREIGRAAEVEVEVLIRRAEICLAHNDVAGFESLRGQMPSAGEEHPDWWAACGRWCAMQERQAEAARCFAEALRLHPHHRTAAYGLGIALRSLGREGGSQPLLVRAGRLEQLSGVLVRLDQDRANRDLMREAAELTTELSRFTEAVGWARLALQHQPRCEWALALLVRLETAPTSPADRAAIANAVLNGIDWESLPRPTFTPVIVRPVRPPQTGESIRFTDEAAIAGIDFRYDNGREPGSSGMRMYEFTGGGVAVLDFDGDERPDLYWTQGGQLGSKGEAAGAVDALFRNLGDRFVSVAGQAGLRDRDYGQGVTSGDYDNDGFADLYVANIGRNRLLHNNGDGTFSDATEVAGLSGEVWTTSCVMADLNGDGQPDLFDCTYLSGDDALRKMCQRDGVSRACDPGGFAAEADRVWLSLGDGRFVDGTRDMGGTAPDGKGLGVVVAELDDTPGLDIFVANDAVANHFFASRSDGAGRKRFEECGLAAGLAFNGEGRAQACMGVAAGDADGDGQLDLLVTNFYREASTLYRQSEPGFFQDWTRRSALYEPSLLMLGFGTQFLDADLDGHSDLIVANGHVDDFSHRGIPFQMPAQFFRNSGEGRFVELLPPAVGDHFQRKCLGRGLATLDWNRDGRPDVAVTHLDVPVALLTNHTREAGHHLAVSLRGTVSPRDAIGARVEAVIGGRSYFQDLTAGDGYQASNQRQLVFGLGAATSVDRLIVHWPSGRNQLIRIPDIDCALRLVEGRSEAVLLTNFESF